MRLPEITDASAAAIRSAQSILADLTVPTLRLGVTGLARAGKTVFITSLVRNLTAGGRLPFFAAAAEGRILSAYLEPQPDDAVPRFDYEGHVATLSADPPAWPESTRRISELRVSIEYRSRSAIKRALGSGKLHLDIVDYPGEWLIDLALMDTGFDAWSADAIASARARGTPAARFLAFVDALAAGASEPAAIEGAALYTAYLQDCRASDQGVATLGPGRFLAPGDLEGSPLVTFFPLDAEPAARCPALAKLLARRFDAYKREIVTPFFRDHFRRLDRQIVLIDALGAVDRGPAAVRDLERALETVLGAFRTGNRGWLDALTGRRIDKLLFAATKADHLPASSHDRLEAILATLTQRAAARATGAGADVHVMAMAALRATREAEAKAAGDRLPLIVGVPLAGEALGAKTFDGRSETALFPGDLPADPASVYEAQPGGSPVRILRFRPPRLAPAGPAGEFPPAPHIRLDRALDYLIGDYLT